MAWSLVNIVNSAGHEQAAAMDSHSVTVAIDVLPHGMTLIELVRRWEEFREVLSAWNPAGAQPVNGRVVQPLRFTSKLICIGANYRDHRQEMAATSDAPKANPFFFLKPPTTALIGPGDDILIRSEEDRVDWEAEVAVVIGTGGRYIKREAAAAHIAGFTLANDISARGCHQQPNAVHPAFAFDWLASKAQDGFCPLGPGIVPSWFIDDIDDIAFDLSVNGEIQQSSTTGYMVTDIRDQIVAASALMTLEPGDVIATGTPAGVGAPRGLFLKPGDTVVVQSPSLGRLENKVRLAPPR